MMITNSVHSHRKSWVTGLGFAVLSVLFSSSAQALSLAQAPLFLVTSAEPLVMLNMSNDHQLFYKAYDDWSDINSDGVQDITYDNDIVYYGYFDSYKCYSYSGGVFVPQAVTSTKYCDTVAGDWSGNFLNWATMSRIDVVRKILYGGYRSTDTDTQTILERSYLSGDAHSFAKYFKTTEAEMGKLTPWSVTELTFCNTTYAADGESEDRTEPPLIRIARGNFALWAASERYQCHWRGHSEPQGTYPYTWGSHVNEQMNNGNNPSASGIDAHYNNPSWTGDENNDGLNDKQGNGDYIVRVQVCMSDALKGEEKCKTYPDGNLKPIGLLQEYGDDAAIKFGLITGSFQKNKSGGVLRKNIGDMLDEINTDTDGTFKSAPSAGNIIKNLDALRVSGYDHNPGTYNATDNCSWGINSFTNGNCSNWGNPQSEIFLESLRYFAGKSPSSAYSANDGGYINNFIKASSWTDPFNSDNYCAPANIIQFNASSISYDGDDMAGTSDLYNLGSMDSWTNSVGATEGINGNSFFIGEGTNTTATDGLCTAKLLTNFADASGVCPDAPRLEGSFDFVGLAYYAHKDGNSIRNDINNYLGAAAEIRVNSYGVTLSPAVPKIEVPVPGSNDVVTILPACRDSSVGGNCAIVDFKVVQPHDVNTGTGSFYINWEDSEQGGDYDQDMAGVLSYTVTSSQITVTTDATGDSTPYSMGFGYVIAGTTKDGFHAHSGIDGFSFTDPTGVTGCSNCQLANGPTSVTYTLDSGNDDLLKDPLWYLAKWGGYMEIDNSSLRPEGTNAPNDIPDQEYEWDDNADGLPDNYFYSTNPAELYTSLSKVFEDISEQTASSASTAANSQKLATGTNIFQATFNSEGWSGGLLKYDVDTGTGGLSLSGTWGADGDAGTELSSTGRVIITYSPDMTASTDDGVAFTWDVLNDLTDTTYVGILNTDPDSGSPDALGEDRLNYLRGDTSKEKSKVGGIFRIRGSLLGDIVNSGPVYVGVPSFGYPDTLEPSAESYSAFITRVGARKKMVYVGANDGMLHGFNVADGSEELAYIPSPVFPRLTQLTSSSYNHQYYVDGSPTAGDAVFADDKWHTVLLGGLNAGGQGIYALDITNPSSFSEANASDIVLWEITPNTTDFGKLGYTFARPSIVKNRGGDWVAVFGNGYNGAGGQAVLYVVNVETGALVSAVEVGAAGGNGLSTAAPVDADGDGVVDAIYAGDLKGNMWKFIPDSGGHWSSAFGSNTPLFKAPGAASVYDKAITARPEVGLHPDGLPGVMVYFGTGRYIDIDDNNTTDLQRFYGIWDVWDNGSSSSYPSAPSTPSIAEANLLRQCVTTGTLDENCVANGSASTGESFGDFDVRFVSSKTITTWNWDSGVGQMGWYFDLPESGERQVTNSVLRGGRIIFVTTIPSDHPCSDGGSSWLMELDAAYGGAIGIPVFDLNGDGVFDENDMKSEDGKYFASSGIHSDSITQQPTILTDSVGEREFKYRSSSKAGSPMEVNTESPPFEAKRRSWGGVK